jgi:ornithine cyclodeaminase/alanine dehydrogenase-like protein (mu-crystallin family)
MLRDLSRPTRRTTGRGISIPSTQKKDTVATHNYLGEDQVRGLLRYEELIPVIRQALIDFSAGRVAQPVRTVLTIPEYRGWFGTMPAVYGDVLGAKLVTFYPGNAAPALHTHMAVIQLFRAATGEPLATMDGRLITEMRTAAVSAVAIDHLASRQARVLAILGSGVQARAHMRALEGIRAFDRVKLWSRSPENARACARELNVLAVTTVKEAVEDADVVLTLTSAPEPIVQGKWLKARAMVCAIGAATPDRRELDSETMLGPVIVESREAAIREAGDIVIAEARISAEIGELLAGAILEPQTPERPIVFKSVGLAVEDIAAAKLVLKNAKK